jgi:hypothetical protein
LPRFHIRIKSYNLAPRDGKYSTTILYRLGWPQYVTGIQALKYGAAPSVFEGARRTTSRKMVHFSTIGLVTVASLTPVVLSAIGPDCINGPLASNKICDVNADATERAAALVAAMRPEEKLRNLVRYVLRRGKNIKS